MKPDTPNAAIANESDWSLGVDSYTHYTRVGRGYLCWATNIVTRGGMLQTRPGRKHIFSLPMGNPQGMCLFRPSPSYGDEVLVWAVSGTVYMSRYPFITSQIVAGLHFDANAPMVRFCAGKKITSLNPDGTLQILPIPYNVLIIQDGATAAGIYDGAGPTGYHIYGGAPTYGTPLGLHMCWSGNRLWVARGDQVFASDFCDPLTFSDSTYLATADNFQLPWDCQGMMETPDERTLLVFCDSSIVSFQSSIADRTMWQQVTDFMKVIVPDTGTTSPRSIFSQYGTTWFYSEFGLTNIDMANPSAGTDRIPPKDIEMIRSKDNLSSDLSGICATAFDTFALVSVPSGAVDNRHTWVIDAAPLSRLGQVSNTTGSGVASWAGVWTGTYPIEFASDIVKGESRCFELSKSCGTINGSTLHIWEDFVGQRWDYLDNPIQCSVELRCFDFGTDLYAFKNIEIDLAEIWGEVNFEIWYAGVKGNFQRIGIKTIEAEIGIFEPDLEIQYDADPATDTVLSSFRPQTRTIRSEQISGSADESPDGTADGLCTPESVYAHNVDKGFQFLLRWTGICAIRQVRVYADPYLEPGVGTCEVDETGETNILSEIGTLPPPQLCSPNIVVAPITPRYLLQTTGVPEVGGQYELYHLVDGTPQAPGHVALLKIWEVNVDVLAGLVIDYSPFITAFNATQTFLWLYRYGPGGSIAINPMMSTVSINPPANIASGTAATQQLLGTQTFFFTVTNVDNTQYSAIHKFKAPPINSPLYIIDTTNYRADSFANINDPNNYHGVISYPSLGFDLYQLVTNYVPGTHTVINQAMLLKASYAEGVNFTKGDEIDITKVLDLTQFPCLFCVLRKGQAPAGKTSDLWAFAGAANMQIGITSASDTASVVRVLPPVALPGNWALPPSMQSIEVANPGTTQLEMALSPSGAGVLQLGFYWPGWDWGIPVNDPFFQGPCGLEVWDTSNNVLQRFTYRSDFGPDGNTSVRQFIDLTALCKAHPQLRIVRFSYFGTATKTLFIDGPAPFELGEATIIGARYTPTPDASIQVANPGSSLSHRVQLNTNIGTYTFAFFVMNVSNQSRYA